MYSGQVLFLLGAFFTFQVNGVQQYNVWLNTQSYHENFVGIVQSAIVTSTSQIEQLGKEVTSLSSDVTDGTKKAFEELTDYRIGAINDIKSQADPSTEHYVVRCISLYGGLSETLQNAAELSVATCVSAQKYQFVTEAEKARNEVIAKSNIAKELTANVEACKNIPNSEECAAHIAIEILLHSIDVPDSIQEITVETIEIVESIKEEITLCLSEKAKVATETIDRYTRYIQTCSAPL